MSGLVHGCSYAEHLTRRSLSFGRIVQGPVLTLISERERENGDDRPSVGFHRERRLMLQEWGLPVTYMTGLLQTRINFPVEPSVCSEDTWLET